MAIEALTEGFERVVKIEATRSPHSVFPRGFIVKDVDGKNGPCLGRLVKGGVVAEAEVLTEPIDGDWLRHRV